MRALGGDAAESNIRIALPLPCYSPTDYSLLTRKIALIGHEAWFSIITRMPFPPVQKKSFPGKETTLQHKRKTLDCNNKNSNNNNNLLTGTRTEKKKKLMPKASCRNLFLPVHLSLLRALHADDDIAGANAAGSFPRPSWVEVDMFVKRQDSIAERESQAGRSSRILYALGGSAAFTPTTSHLKPGSPPDYTNGRKRQRGAAEAEYPTTKRNAEPSRVGQTGGLGSALGSRETLALPAAELDPRSVVCAVLRRAVKNREDEHRLTCAGLRGLRRGVDDIVDRLESSLERSARRKEERATPWRLQESGVTLEADIVERCVNKLLLWRRLQEAMSGCCVAVDI